MITMEVNVEVIKIEREANKKSTIIINFREKKQQLLFTSMYELLKPIIIRY
jgi:hypothetical protein